MRYIWRMVLAAALVAQNGDVLGGESMTAAAMPSDRFWSLIDATAEDEADPDAQLARFQSVLSALAPEEIVAFQHTFDQEMTRSYSWDLWGAAYVAHGGASDDSFDYFRHWLISKGRDVYEADRDVRKYAWLDEYEPFTTIDRSVYVYDTRAGSPGSDPGWR